MKKKEQLTKKTELVDGRTVLFLTICSCVVTFLSTNLLGHALFTCWLFIILCYFGKIKQGVSFFGVYIIAIVFILIQTKYKLRFPSPLLMAMIYKLIMPAMPACLLGSIPSGKLMAGLRKLPIPNGFTLILIVMIRFVPTVFHEFGEVKEAMKIRGFLKSAGNVLKHPLDTLEYAVVPMVFRSLKIADELAASAIVRGIESPYKKESYYVSLTSLGDVMFMIVSTVAAFTCCAI